MSSSQQPLNTNVFKFTSSHLPYFTSAPLMNGRSGETAISSALKIPGEGRHEPTLSSRHCLHTHVSPCLSSLMYTVCLYKTIYSRYKPTLYIESVIYNFDKGICTAGIDEENLLKSHFSHDFCQGWSFRIQWQG